MMFTATARLIVANATATSTKERRQATWPSAMYCPTFCTSTSRFADRSVTRIAALASAMR